MKNNIQLILDGKHDEALEYFDANERQRRELKVWDEKNENKLSEYLKDKPKLAAQLKFKLPQKEEDLKVKVDESKLTPTFLVEYLTFLYKVGEPNIPYIPKKYSKIIGKRTNAALEWIMENHDTKVFVLTVDSDEEKRRHVERNDTQSEVWLSGRRSQISNILTNFNLMGKIEVRQNNSFESSQRIKEEIMEILNGEIHGES